MPMQARLMRRKKWYTLEDAARRLSLEFSEEVEIKDVVQLVLDNELPVSIHVDGMPGRKLDVIHLDHRPGRPIFAEVSRYRTEFYADGTVKKQSGGPRKWLWLAGIYHLRLYDDAIEGWRGWLQGFEKPDFDSVSFALSEPSDPAECYTPLFIDGDFNPHVSCEYPDINEWIITRSDLDTFIAEEAEHPPEQPTEDEELRALEALGLLAVTVAKQAPRYQRNGKPNKAQIAEAMSQQAGEVYGMSISKLQRLLSDALDAWEEKRG